MTILIRRLTQLVLIVAALLLPVNARHAQEGAHGDSDIGVAVAGCSGPSQTQPRATTSRSTKSGLELYDEVVADARRCASEEKCAIAGGVKGCRCPVAVRDSAKARVDKAAREASCEQVERLFCPPLQNPRCEKETCIADQVDE